MTKIRAAALRGTHDVVFVTFDTLRLDVAVRLLNEGRTPHLASVLPPSGWEHRHTPATFTYAAHHAFFAGFLPTPSPPAPDHRRLFAVRFEGSTSVGDDTLVFDAPDIVRGFAACGYHTLCIGGVGFFNKQNPLGSVLPGLFLESHWSDEFSVRNPSSITRQVELACARLLEIPSTKRVFLFLNVSAIHQPNCIYCPGTSEDSLSTHAAALEHVDREIAPLFSAIKARAPTLLVMCSDHGTAYGEDGIHGHRVPHAVVWDVPYAEVLFEGTR